MRLAALLFLGCLPAMARAQTAADTRAFEALRATSIGALTPLQTPAMISRRLNGAQLALRYGLMDERGARSHAVAASGLFGVGLASSVHLTAGVLDGECASCSPALLLGAGGDMRVLEAGEVLGSGSTFSLAVSGELAYAQIKPGDDNALALGVGAPMTLTFGATSEGMRIAPFFVPIFGIGQSGQCPLTDPNCERSGTRWVLGGGLGVWNPLTSVSISLGINHVMFEGAQPVYGINVVVGGR